MDQDRLRLDVVKHDILGQMSQEEMIQFAADVSLTVFDYLIASPSWNHETAAETLVRPILWKMEQWEKEKMFWYKQFNVLQF
jgi:hypothetical protein